MADTTEDKGIFRIVPARHAAVITRRLLASYVWIGIAIYLLLAYFGLRGGGDLRFALVALIFSFGFLWFRRLMRYVRVRRNAGMNPSEPTDSILYIMTMTHCSPSIRSISPQAAYAMLRNVRDILTCVCPTADVL